METPRPDRTDIRRRTLAMPYGAMGEVIDESTALAYYEDLRTNNPALFEHINEQIDAIDKDIGEKMGDQLAPQVRRGIIARAAIASAAQVVNDTGQSILDIELLQQLLGGELPTEAAEHPRPNDPPAA